MTIGQTSVKLSTIIDHSLRRIGIPAEAQTPEIVTTAKNNLFFILNNFTNKGMNYWCIDQQYITLVEGKVVYDMPDGTVDILDTNYRTMTMSTGTDLLISPTEFARQFTGATSVKMFQLNSTNVGTITVSYSDDGVTYTTHSTVTHNGGNEWHFIEPINTTYFKLSIATGVLTVTNLVTVTEYSDIPLYRMNRNEYSNLPNKTVKERPFQFWFDRQLTPRLHIWPTANTAATEDCIQLFRRHQIPDLGSLTEELSIPNRWLEATIWGLAQNMSFEIPNTPPDRVTMCSTMADKTLNEAQIEERDNSTIQLTPNIGVYNA